MSRMLKALQQLDAKRRQESSGGESEVQTPQPASTAVADREPVRRVDEVPAVENRVDNPPEPAPPPAREQQLEESLLGGDEYSQYTWVADFMPGLAVGQDEESEAPSEPKVIDEAETASLAPAEVPCQAPEEPPVPDSVEPIAEEPTPVDETATVDTLSVASTESEPPAAVEDETAATPASPPEESSAVKNAADEAVVELDASNDDVAPPAAAPTEPGETGDAREETIEREAPLSETLLKKRFDGPPPEPPTPPTHFERRVEERLQAPQSSAEYRRLADGISADYDGSEPACLMFSATQPDSDLGEAIAHIAPLLADKFPKGRILLIDADIVAKPLGKAFERTTQPGLIEIIGRHKNWRDYVVRTSQERIDFLPSGQGEVASYKTVGDRLMALLRELRQQYAYVLFAAGAVQQPLVARLAPAADASYLYLDLGQTESKDATAAARQLQAAGARLRGCIVRGAAKG